MSAKKQKFAAQPALDKAEWKKQKCAATLAQAVKNLEHEKHQLAAVQTIIAKTVQQIHRNHDNLTAHRSRQAAVTLVERHQFLVRLQSRKAELEREAANHLGQVRWARECVALRREELLEASHALESFRKIKERWLAHQRKLAEKAWETERADNVSMNWRPPGP